MAIKLNSKWIGIVNDFYEDWILTNTGLNIDDLRRTNGQKFRFEKKLSFYLQIGSPTIESAEDLYQLTKMLTVEQSPKEEIIQQTGSTSSGGTIRGVFEVIANQAAGAGESKKKQIYKTLIYPGIYENYINVINDPDMDPIMKRLIKDWWSKDKDKIYDLYMAFGKELPANAPGDSSKIFAIILNPSTSYEKNMIVLEKFGFSDYASKIDPNTLWWKGLWGEKGSMTLSDLEKKKKEDPAAFAAIVTAALNIETDLTEEDLNNLNQCALITALIHGEPKWDFERYIEPSSIFESSPLRAKAPGNKRIYPVQIDNYNPNKLINNCVINKKIKDVFNTGDTKSPHNMAKGIFWVYEDNKGQLREAELSLNTTAHKKKISNILYGETDFLKQSRFNHLDKRRDGSYYFLENTQITFDGTNPSTARNDVKVEMTWKLGSLEGLDSTMAILGPDDGLDTETVITIKDLITLPITKKPNVSDGPGQFITNQYSPNYSRLRLKAAPYGDENASHQSDCMLLDLAIIDHQISRSSETGETTLTISYRGYFEATLNMPFNDVLASDKVRKDRVSRQEKGLDKLKAEGCKAETVREALRLEQEIFRTESMSTSVGSILLKMETKRLIHSYELDDLKLRAGTFGNVLDGTTMYVNHIAPSSGTMLGADEIMSLSASQKDKKEDSEEKAAREKSLKKLDKKFFFLGDLMWVLLGCLYEPNSSDHAAAVRNMNLRFIVGSIYIPDPNSLGGSPKTINPISAPIDLKFFVQWFNATVVNKGLTFYPIGTFIRDLVERLVNDIIYDTCFSLLLPDENPPLLRSRTFVTSGEDWFEKNEKGWFDPKKPFNSGSKDLDILFPKSFVSEAFDGPSGVPSNAWSQKINSKNYCVIYQQFPSYKRQLAAENNRTLKEDEYTPTIYYGAKNKNYNFLSDVSFTKTNSPFLREARFFNTNYGGLSLLSNVYDLSFSFKRRKANTLFYPGCIINFILLDWGPRWVDEPPWTDGPIHHLGIKPDASPAGFQERRLGQSDPHIEGTTSNIMGMGGYFIIKSVEYSLGQTPGEFEIKVDTKFLGTDASKAVSRTDSKDKRITDKEECRDAFNIIADRFNELAATDQLGGEPVLRARLLEAPADQESVQTPTSERETEVVGEAEDGDKYGESKLCEDEK